MNTQNDTDLLEGIDIRKGAEAASLYLRALANPLRLVMLCELNGGEKCVGELEESLGMSQAYVSQQLARLRAEGLVEGRRDGRTVYYRITDERVKPMIEMLYEQFCSQ